MKILIYGQSNSGCLWIRVRTPLKEFLKDGHKVFYTDGLSPVDWNGWDIVIINNLIGEIDRMYGGQKIGTIPIEELLQRFKAGGAKIVYDTDDAQGIIPEHVANRKKLQEAMPSFKSLTNNADVVTVTTPELKDYVGQFTKKKIVVLPNCIDPDEFPPRGHEDKVKIGYAGSQSHVKDINIAWPAVKAMKAKHGVYFELLGFQHDFCKYKKPVAIEDYYKTLASLNADIGICPLEETVFNSCKSPLKFLEYAMVGTMCLASNKYPYKREMKREWLCDDDEWEEKLDKYISDKELRESTLQEQIEWVLKNRDIRDKYILWEKLYSTLLSPGITKKIGKTLGLKN